MKLIHRYRSQLMLGMIVALWAYAGAVWFLDPDTASIVRIVAYPFVLAGIIALATHFSE